ncbi:MAG: ATP-binding protein [Pseudomonadota bacterium]
MKDLIARWESFLRLERLGSAADLFKARTVYATAMAFAVVQTVNFAQMLAAYDGWILDHTLLAIAMILTSGSALSLRYRANFEAISILWSVIILGAVGGTAIPADVGINSALLPVLVAGIAVVALIGSRRSLVFYCISALILTVMLHLNAADADLSVLSDPDYVALRNMQRTMQTLIAVVLVGTVMGLLGFTQDRLFRSLEANVAAARAAESVKAQFLADMSHELRTPLNGVLGMNQLLLRGPLDDTQRSYARIIDECGSGMIAVIDDILDLSRLEATGISLKPTDFDPARMLDSVMSLHQASARAKGLSLSLTVEPGLPSMVRGDHGRLRQIVGNLISNAVKFTDTGAVSVVLRGRPLQGEASEPGDAAAGRWWFNIFVRDTGIGITPDRVERIFGRFEQAQDSDANSVRGSGLGLAIAHELAALFGGTITVQSEPGRGSLFCLALPLDAVPDRPAVAPPPGSVPVLAPVTRRA